MKAKKFLGFLTTAVLTLGLMTGCGSQETKSTTTQASSEITEAATTAAATETEEPTQTSAGRTTDGETGKTLVVYYSASGRTKTVAETIAETAGADLFEIVPDEPYTSEDLDWTNDDSRVSREHDNESLRDVELVKVTPDNWDSYDTILIGYPIWWGIAAWPVDNFVKGNDFSGKTVIPFCTSSSSGLGQSGTLLEQMAGTGTWQEGQRFSSGASASEVQDWVNSLGLAK
ncbi:flavodoxin [Coprococcus hominis (ex Arizal et al. 2022)]|uniref:flavodoxin n=1 Tax=Coprococcus hominis (ex Arizal et al. 2022) TaxID=2881262 RepID=UPI0018A9C867